MNGRCVINVTDNEILAKKLKIQNYHNSFLLSTFSEQINWTNRSNGPCTVLQQNPTQTSTFSFVYFAPFSTHPLPPEIVLYAL